MLARIQSAALLGVDAILVDVEVHLGSGLPAFTVVGLPQGAVREGRERVGAALRSSGVRLPPKRITVNLAPGDVRKSGTSFDLAIAVGLLIAGGHIPFDSRHRIGFIGELALDGGLRPSRGVLSIASRCAAEGVQTLVVPEPNAAEAGLVGGIAVLGCASLAQVIAHFRGESLVRPTRTDPEEPLARPAADSTDLAEVTGQESAKRVLEIAAAGSHNLLFLGPPGAGKTMLARRLAGILPPPTVEESLETSRIHSVAGLLPPGRPVVLGRPFRAPHHTISDAGLVGGGAPAGPGEVSLAHNGVLFLDELAEFRRSVLEVLRQPLEEGEVHVSRASGSVRFPARILLVAAMNPCPCGFWEDGSDRCLCDPAVVARYRGRISGPLLDRIDMHVAVPAVPIERMTAADSPPPEPSAVVRARVVAARNRQHERFRDTPGVFANGQMGPAQLRRWCRPSRPVVHLLQTALDRFRLSARAYHRILKVGRTIADLEGAESVTVDHVAEAIHYRQLDRPTEGSD